MSNNIDSKQRFQSNQTIKMETQSNMTLILVARDSSSNDNAKRKLLTKEKQMVMPLHKQEIVVISCLYIIKR